MKDQCGRCQCGQVSYRLLNDAVMLYVCHCLGCQKQSSSAFAMSLRMRREDVEVTGDSLRFWETFADSGEPKICAFCSHCGCRIYHGAGHDSETINVKPGTLDDTSWLNPQGHIWTKRAQPWARELTRANIGLPNCESQPDDMIEFLSGNEG